MRLSDHAEKYVKDNQLRARTIAANCRRFERVTGISDAALISTKLLNAFRQACVALKLSTDTIEKTITDVSTIVKHVCGSLPDAGKRLKRKRPDPNPVPIEDLDAMFFASPIWLQKWIAIDYWTGARLADSVKLFLLLDAPRDVVTLNAEKTGLRHQWPVPPWLATWMRPIESPIKKPTLYFRKVLSSAIAQACSDAGVTAVTAKQFRQRSITEWTRANATAGAIVHGSGLGVMAHYLDPLSVLESAAPRVRLPACFGACSQEASEATLLDHYRRLDPSAQGLMFGMAERLAAG